MDAARKAELSRKGKERWANSKIIAARICCPVDRVNNAYGRIQRAGLLNRALTGDAPYDDVLAVIDPPASVKVHEPEEQEELATTDMIKVTAWYINKVGGPPNAIKLVKLVGKIVDEFEKD